MKLRVNGDEREVEPGSTLAQVVVAIGARPEGVAVARNGEVVPRSELAATRVADGDRIEVIRAVGGG